MLKNHADNFSISISDPGTGPAPLQLAAGDLGTRHAGLGTQIVETLARQINATLAKKTSANGYEVTVTVPHH